MAYRIVGLDPASFQPLFGLSDGELKARGMSRMTVTAPTGFPCRISLADRHVGEQVILLNHVSHEVANPYRASHAIFVGDRVARGEFVDEVPPVFRSRILSLRGFDGDGMMADARIAPVGEAEEAIMALLANPAIASIHAHNAVRGCFAAKIERY